jgi:hypothetical protein
MLSMDVFFSMGTGCGFVQQVKEIDALSSFIELMAASPSVHFQNDHRRRSQSWACL